MRVRQSTSVVPGIAYYGSGLIGTVLGTWSLQVQRRQVHMYVNDLNSYHTHRVHSILIIDPIFYAEIPSSETLVQTTISPLLFVQVSIQSIKVSVSESDSGLKTKCSGGTSL